jgi:hypothetical protein
MPFHRRVFSAVIGFAAILYRSSRAVQRYALSVVPISLLNLPRSVDVMTPRRVRSADGTMRSKIVGRA